MRTPPPPPPPPQVEQWKEKHPIRRFFLYLKSKGWWDDGQDRLLRDKERIAVLKVSHRMSCARFYVFYVSGVL